MQRILTGLVFALPILVATSLPKPASALEATTNPQLHRYADTEYLTQYEGRYQQEPGRYGQQDRGRYQQEPGRYGEQDRGQYQQEPGRYGQQDRGRYQQRRTWVPAHYEDRNHRRFFVRGHYIYR